MAIAVLLVGLLPACRMKNVLLCLLGRGWSIARSARIQPNVLWRVRRLQLGEGAYIGPGNAFREIALVELGENAEIGQFNWFSAAAQYVRQADKNSTASLVMETNSAITSRHYVDCSGGVRLEPMVLVAGVRSTILTHSINAREWQQEAEPVVLGRSSLVFTNVVITAGTTIADGCLVAAGAVVAEDLDVPGKLYAGVPARIVADMSTAAYLHRSGSRDVSRDEARALLRASRRSGKGR